MANIAPIRTSAEIATIINKAQHALADLGWQIVNEEKQGITVQDVYHRDKVYQLLLLDVMLKNILDENGNVIQYYQASANEEKFNNILSGLLDLSKDFDGPAIPMLVARNSTLVFYPSVQSSTGVPSGGPATPGGTTFQNLSVNSPGATLDSFSSNQSQFVFYIVAVRSAAGAARTSIMSGSWVGSNTPVYTETRTEDVGGSTADLVLKIELSGGNIQLNAYTTTTGWSVQGLRILFQNISFSNALGPLPAGGTTNQLLKKNSNNDYDVSWFTLTVAALTDLMATVTELNYSQGLTSNIQTQINAIISSLSNYLLLSGGTMTGPINMGGQALTNLTPAINPSDAVRFDQVQVTKAIFDIGDWNMLTTSVVAVAFTGINITKIRSVQVEIRSDTAELYQLPYIDNPSSPRINGFFENVSNGANPFILIRRTSSGVFNNFSFSITGYNRGWVIVEYIP